MRAIDRNSKLTITIEEYEELLKKIESSEKENKILRKKHKNLVVIKEDMKYEDFYQVRAIYELGDESREILKKAFDSWKKEKIGTQEALQQTEQNLVSTQDKLDNIPKWIVKLFNKNDSE